MGKIAFIQDVLFDFHGIEYLSAVLKQHSHDVDIFVLDSDKGDVIDWIKNINPNLIGFSISSINHKWSLDIAKRAKEELGIMTLFGGPHPTCFPEFIENPYVDIICVGEGEEAIVELMDKIDSNADITQIQNLCIKHNGQICKNEVRPLIDLSELSIPDKGLYFKYKFLRDTLTKRISPTRGCSYNCTFCYNQKYNKVYKGKGKLIRYRPVLSIINEILYVKRNSKLKFVSFVSDTFTTNHKWLYELLYEYKKKIDVPFFCQAIVNELNEEVIFKLKESGCHYISFGIESGSERIRIEILNKKISNEQIRKAARLCKKYQLHFGTFNIFGLPTETLEEAFETVKLNAEIGASVISATVLQPNEGTQIYDFIKESDLFVNHYDTERIGGQYRNLLNIESPLKLKNKKEILNLQKLAYLGVRFPRTIPLLKILIKFPPNLLFNLILKFTLFMRYKNTRNYSLFVLTTTDPWIDSPIFHRLKSPLTVLQKCSESFG